MTLHFLLCSDLDAKVAGLNEFTHAHKSSLVAHPALQLVPWYECQAINAAGRLLTDMASSERQLLTMRSCPVSLRRPEVKDEESVEEKCWWRPPGTQQQI